MSDASANPVNVFLPINRKRILIHLGFHKTGSTYIQSLLHTNGDFLSRRIAVFHRENGSSKRLREACLSFLNSGKSSRRLSKENEDIESAAKALLSLSRTSRLVLISDEELAGYMPGRLGTLTVYSRIGEVGEKLVSAFSPHPVEFVVYWRESARWLRSVYNQAVKQHRMWLSERDFINSLNSPVDLQKIISTLRESVGEHRVHAFAYEEDRSGALGLGASLFSLLGLSQHDILSLDRSHAIKNASLKPAALELMLAFNRSPLSRENLDIVRAIVLANQEVLDSQSITNEPSEV